VIKLALRVLRILEEIIKQITLAKKFHMSPEVAESTIIIIRLKLLKVIHHSVRMKVCLTSHVRRKVRRKTPLLLSLKNLPIPVHLLRARHPLMLALIKAINILILAINFKVLLKCPSKIRISLEIIRNLRISLSNPQS